MQSHTSETANKNHKFPTNITSLHMPSLPYSSILCTNTCNYSDKQASTPIHKGYLGKISNTGTTNPEITLETIQHTGYKNPQHLKEKREMEIQRTNMHVHATHTHMHAHAILTNISMYMLP